MDEHWKPFDRKTVPVDELLLFEYKYGKTSRYSSGTFNTTQPGQSIGVINGMFHFDITLIRYRSIQHLLPEDS